MMSDHTIDQALIELARTTKALQALRAKRKQESLLTGGHGVDFLHRCGADQQTACLSHPEGVIRFRTLHQNCAKEHSAAVRASMDLTRKLADLRAGR